MTYFWDPKRGAAVPINVVERETIAAETNTRTVLQRRGLAEQVKIQQLCIRFGNLVQKTLNTYILAAAQEQWVKITTPSLVALETKLRREISVEQQFHRLHNLILAERDDVFEIETRALQWTDESRRVVNVSVSRAGGTGGGCEGGWEQRRTRRRSSRTRRSTSRSTSRTPTASRVLLTENEVDRDRAMMWKMESLSKNSKNTTDAASSRCFTQRRHAQRDFSVTLRVCNFIGTQSRLRYQQEKVWNKRREQRLRYLRHVLPLRHDAALLLQRLGRGSAARAILRVPMTTVTRTRTRAGLILLKFLRRCVALSSGKREAAQLNGARDSQRSASLSVDRGLRLRIFVQTLQQYAYYAIATRLRAARLHAVVRIKAHERRKRFFAVALCVLRRLVRKTRRRQLLQERDTRELRSYSAVTIQCLARRFLARIRVARGRVAERDGALQQRDLLELRNYSARRIQALYRRWSAKTKAIAKLAKVKAMRRRLQEYNERRNFAASVIGRSWRAHRQVIETRRELERLKLHRLRVQQERLARLNQPFDQSIFGGENNPFAASCCDRKGSAFTPDRGGKDHLANFSNLSRNSKTGKATAVVFTSRRDPVVPSAFAWLRGLPHAMPKFDLTPQQEDELRQQRLQRRRNIIAHDARCRKNMDKLIQDPLRMSKQTREILSQGMGIEATLPGTVEGGEEKYFFSARCHNDDDDDARDNVEVGAEKENQKETDKCRSRQGNTSRDGGRRRPSTAASASESALSSSTHFLLNLKKQVQAQHDQIRNQQQQQLQERPEGQQQHQNENRSNDSDQDERAVSSCNVSSIHHNLT